MLLLFQAKTAVISLQKIGPFSPRYRHHQGITLGYSKEKFVKPRIRGQWVRIRSQWVRIRGQWVRIRGQWVRIRTQ